MTFETSVATLLFCFFPRKRVLCILICMLCVFNKSIYLFFQKEESWSSSRPVILISSSLTPVPLWCGSSPVICSGTVSQHCEYITPPCALHTSHTVLMFFSYSHCFCHLLICHFIHFLSFCLCITSPGLYGLHTHHSGWVCLWE